MGLDVYLYRYENPPKPPTEDDDDEKGARINRPSTKHPGHMFTVGYLRSSYNEGGINRVMAHAIGKDLGDLFGVGPRAPYKILPNWSECAERARAALAEFQAWIKANGGLRVASMDFFASSLRPAEMIDSPERALAAYLAEKGKQRPADFESYRNGQGHFFMSEKPLQVRAVVTGKRESIIAKLHGRQVDEPCAYVVYEADLTWYVQALEVVVETCEWVLAQPDHEKHYLHWSG